MTNLAGWQGCNPPSLPVTYGRYVSLVPAAFPDCAEALFNAIGGVGSDDLWDHLAIGPFGDAVELGATLIAFRNAGDWLTHLICSPAGNVLGMASYMRNRPSEGSSEVGCVVYSKQLQQTPAATEAIYLMAKHLFDDLGYRRFEWKCDNANEASKRAALRFGFSFEGIFRQDQVIKGCNRDTAWYAMLDHEWPQIKARFEAWLDPANFDEDGQQKRSLQDLQR